MTPEQFGELTRRRLILFLSVDMEGSTRLKQTFTARDAQRWLEIVLRFTEDFPQAFRAKREEHGKHQKRGVPEPKLWKMLGDELLFRAEPEQLHDVAALVETFQAAVDTLNKRTREARREGDIFPLLKGAAWTAGFPVTNAVVRIENGGEDFLGPSMDAGFRVAKLSSSRRFAVSVELAWLLSHAETRANVTLHFEGCAEVKGVAEESGYPAIWLEMAPSEYKKLEDELLGRGAKDSAKKVHKLCEAFITEFGVPDYLPFLPNSAKVDPPDDYENRYKLAIESLRRLYVVDDPGARPTRPKRQAERDAEKLRDLLKARPPRRRT